jgi:CheY-like chemotaxis protein
MTQIALIVDDDAASRFLLQHMLRKLGFDILEAENGAQALDILHDTSPDIVFLDILLPGLNGASVIEYIHADAHLRNTPVIVVSAHIGYNDPNLLGPKDVFLLKPAKAQDIREAINQAISGSGRV